VSSPPDQQRSLSAALDETMREASALSVLFSQAVADRVRLNPTDLESLDILIRSGPITAGRLAELTGLTTGAVTGLVDRLERRGYVVREPNPADRRSVLVRPLETPIARDIAPAYDAMRSAFEQLTSGYSDSEIRLVLDFMTRATAMTREQIAALRGNAWHRT
jgi:DNA-binding MarR family transcriptional regulator